MAVAGRTHVQVDLGSRSEPYYPTPTPQPEEAEPDFLGLLRTEEIERLSKENSELVLEVQRARAQLVQAQGLQEKVTRLERLAATSKDEIDRLQADCETSEQRAEEERLRASGLSEQLMAAKAREDELLKQELAKTVDLRERVKQAEIDAVKFMALNAKVAALTEECEEAKVQLEKAEKVRGDLLRGLQDRNAELDRLRQEIKELREYERSKTAQVVELTKSAAALEERVANLSKSLQGQEAATKRAEGEVEETRAALAKSQEEARALKGRVADFEAKSEQLQNEVEREKATSSRLREDLARAESLASEREVALRAAAKREEQLGEQVSQQQSRADTAQAALLTEKACVQRLESELQAAKAAHASARSELERVIREEEAARAEILQRADKKVAAETARLGAEVGRLEDQLQQLMEQLAERNRSSAEMEVQLSRAGSRQTALEVALEEAHRSKDEAHAARAEAFRRLQDFSHSEKAVMTSRRRFIECGASPASRYGRAGAVQGQDDLAATWRGEQGGRAAGQRSASERPTTYPGRHLGMQDVLESSSTFASSSKSDLLQEPIALEPVGMAPQQARRPMAYEPIALRHEEPRKAPAARKPVQRRPWHTAQESRSSEAAGPCEPKEEEPLLGPSHPGVREMAGTLQPEERPSDLVAGLAPKDPLPPDGIEPPRLVAIPKQQDALPPDATVPPVLVAMPRKQGAPFLPTTDVPASASCSTQAAPLELPRARIQVQCLAAWDKHLAMLERWQLLSVVWRAWASPAKVSALRARLELILLDELRLAKVREEAQEELKRFLQPKLRNPESWPQVFGGPLDREPCDTSDGAAEAGSLERKLFVMKSFVFEFRKRVAEAVAELPGALHGFVEGEAFQTTLEIGRGSFGRLLHASLFLYQKLRTLVPSELEETMKDPVSRLVPVPFYVLPYKFRLAVHRGVSGLAQGFPAPRRGSGPRAQLQELQDMMPLCTSDGAVPNFLLRLLAVRAHADEGAVEPTTEQAAAGHPSGMRDGLDQLVVDALTVYMSGWRISNGGPAKVQATSEPLAVPERRGRSTSAPVGRLHHPRPKPGFDPHVAEPKLRLGPERTL